jgi:hypothetical protein
MSEGVQIVSLPIGEGLEYGCLPCSERGRDVDAVVVLEGTYGVLSNPCHTYLCGHHAECVDLSNAEVQA